MLVPLLARGYYFGTKDAFSGELHSFGVVGSAYFLLSRHVLLGIFSVTRSPIGYFYLAGNGFGVLNGYWEGEGRRCSGVGVGMGMAWVRVCLSG